MLVARWLAVLPLTIGLFGCGSDPLRDPDAEAGSSSGATSSAARGGAGGRGGTGGKGGAGGAAPEVPDYTRSPCYGESAETLVYDLETHDVTSVQATCRGEGNRTLFYVADALFETEYEPGAAPFTQADVNAFLYSYELFGRSNGYRPELGVLPTDELVFGTLDEAGLTDGKLPIFLVSSGRAGQGYLCSWCDRLELHLDGPLLRSLRTDEALSIAAHETVHAIHRGYDANEESWVDETLAQAAMTVNGYFTDGDWLAAFLRDPNRQWGPGLTDPLAFDYGAGLLFGTFLWERGGAELLGAITRDPKNGWAGIDAALAGSGDAGDGYAVYRDMAVAAWLDAPEGGYGFTAFDTREHIVPVALGAGASRTQTLAPYGIVYVALDAGTRTLLLESDAPLDARLVLGGPTELLEAPVGEEFSLDRAAEVLVLTAPDGASFTLYAR